MEPPPTLSVCRGHHYCRIRDHIYDRGQKNQRCMLGHPRCIAADRCASHADTSSARTLSHRTGHRRLRKPACRLGWATKSPPLRQSGSGSCRIQVLVATPVAVMRAVRVEVVKAKGRHCHTCGTASNETGTATQSVLVQIRTPQYVRRLLLNGRSLTRHTFGGGEEGTEGDCGTYSTDSSTRRVVLAPIGKAGWFLNPTTTRPSLACVVAFWPLMQTRSKHR